MLATGWSLPSTLTSSSRACGTAASISSLRSNCAARSSAAANCSRLRALLTPTLLPMLAGLTKSGYGSVASIASRLPVRSPRQERRASAKYGACGSPAAANSRRATILSIPTALASTPEPT